MEASMHVMMVVMQPGTALEDIEAIRNQAQEAALDADVVVGTEQSIIVVTGVLDPGFVERLDTLPGVEEVVHRGNGLAPDTSDLRVESIRPLLPPAVLLEELPLTRAGAVAVSRSRAEVVRILDGEDDRLLVVVGPCSMHDPAAALDYGQRLKTLSDQLAPNLCIVMRAYFEKPRTTIGWKGLINDPHLDNSFAVNDGLQMTRALLLELIALGLPVGCEFLDPILPQFFADLVTWGAIGARTTESQVHRHLASGLSMPVGFKNGTGGSVQIALDGVRAAASPHSFLGVTEQGIAAVVSTRGNPDCHVILRGSATGPNYGATDVRHTLDLLRGCALPARVMIDTSHGNSGKDYRRQPAAAGEVGSQVASGEKGIVGLLMESFLEDGAQDLGPEQDLVYGQSITDGCMGWEMTVPVLRGLAESVRVRRSGAPAPTSLSSVTHTA
ncbi:MAG: 3-deoxy-7-phosphoheptulonate synthase [Chloroflexota bacterium]|nr:3-deoxy-7-phosphoheptulonate synthase [Chloroflexota bacterium]